MLNGIELIKTRYNEKNDVVVSGRELHEFLEIGTEYRKWFGRMIEYGFEENQDFVRVTQKCPTPGGMQEMVDYAIKLDMAKEIAMIQRSEKGKQARQYFIEIEKRWNSPEMIMKRALEYANEQVAKLEMKVEEQKPKVLLAESIENSHSLILVGELAKILKQNGFDIGQNRLYERLRDMGYLVKSGASKNSPTQRSMELGLFRVVEGTRTNDKGVNITKTTKVTGKGQKYFINKFLKEVK